jgi:hypothetical protein
MTINSIIVSGEGRTDIGGSHSGQAIATGVDFDKGPMSSLIEKILERHLPNWNKDLLEDAPLIFKYVSHGYLKRQAEHAAKGNGKFALTSKDVKKQHLGKYKQARELAKLSVEQECQVAVYFIDCDGRNEDKSKNSSLQLDIVESINQGFKKGKAQSGIAMVPKPTSEAWLICHCQTTPYLNCGNWEINLSGNDNCPDENSPKKVLEGFIGADYADDIVIDKVDEINIDNLVMPSFTKFKNDAKLAIRAVCGTVED